MNGEENVQLVQQHFIAVGKHDLPAILDSMAEDVDFQSPVTRTEQREISWAKPSHNREEVAAFFNELFEKVQPERFETLGFISLGDWVVVEGRNSGIVKATGRSYEHDWVMLFTLHEGKIVRFRHYYDPADIEVTFRRK